MPSSNLSIPASAPSPHQIPFGIARIGKAYRDEIVTKNSIFRTCEFEQMEMQCFVKPGDDVTYFECGRE